MYLISLLHVQRCQNTSSLQLLSARLNILKWEADFQELFAFAGTMLHITPVVSIEDGKVVVIGKTRGKKH